jgi:hypothetical protein
MFDEAWQLFTQTDSFAVIEFLSRQDDPTVVVDTYNDLVRYLYNTAKNIPGMISLGRAGIQYGLAQAAAVSDPALAAEIKGRAKAISYNVAAFTWPGWDEPGIEITRTDLAMGMDAARTNLRLARELQRGDLPMSRAHWVIGAHHLAVKDYDAARREFDDAARLAASAGEPGEALLSKGYAALVDVLQGGDAALLDALKTELSGIKDGEFFVGQIDSAQRVFSR